MVKINLAVKHLDDTVREEMVELLGEVFAVILRCDNNKPGYHLFIDTTEYDSLWRKTTKGWDPKDNWRDKLDDLFKKQPDLKQRLSAEGRYMVPLKVLRIPHELGGGHGDLRLRFNRGNLIFMPLSDYKRFLREFTEACAILYDGKRFVKGSTNDLKRYGAYLTDD